MKIECNKRKIEEAVQKAVRLANKHITLPVLSCIYIESFKEDKLVLRSTNLDIGLEVVIKVKIIKEGSVTVPATVLLATLSSKKDENLTIETVENNLKVLSGKNSVLIKCLPKDDFPSIPKIENLSPNTKNVVMKSGDLINGFKSVWYSASNSSVKPELCSVFVYKGDNGLVFASTDSFRLAEKKINTKISEDFPQVLIPYKNVVEIIKLFEDYNGDINIVFDKNQASFEIEGLYVVSRLIDGSFPDYKQIIPKSFTSTVTIIKNDLLNSIKTSNIFSDNLNQVKFKIDSKNKTLHIESKNNDVGEYSESIKAVISGEDIELNFNNKYIVDCLQSISSDSLVLNFGGAGRPLIISGVSDKSFLYMVMPMNR